MHIYIAARSAMAKQGQDYFKNFEDHVRGMSGAKSGVVFREIRMFEVVCQRKDEEAVMSVLNGFKLSIWQEKINKILDWMRKLKLYPFEKTLSSESVEPHLKGKFWMNIMFLGRKYDDANPDGKERT